jgi:1,2-diacylglycerol 3-beta-glucosyltransferase
VLLAAALAGADFAMTGVPSIASYLVAAELLALIAYVLRGVAFSGTGFAGLLALATAPAYIAWKLVVARPWKKTDRWVRTTRASEEQAAATQLSHDP